MPYFLGFAHFQPVGPNVVYDMFTGLEWVADPSEIGPEWGANGEPIAMTWDEAIEKCNKLNYGGHNDWRLPNTKELETLIHYGKLNPSIDDKNFKRTKSDYYWTSSITNHGCDNQFDPNFGSGQKNWDQDKKKKKYARPVRGKMVKWPWEK